MRRARAWALPMMVLLAACYLLAIAPAARARGEASSTSPARPGVEPGSAFSHLGPASTGLHAQGSTARGQGDGLIAFWRDGDIWVAQADGSGQRLLVRNPGALAADEGGAYGGLSWSPDGSRLAFFIDGSSVYTVNADGSGLKKVDAKWPSGDAHEKNGLSDLAWSPDGRSIAFCYGIYGVPWLGAKGAGILNLATGRTRMLNATGTMDAICWHPSGSYVTVSARLMMAGPWDERVRFFGVFNVATGSRPAPRLAFPAPGIPAASDLRGGAWNPQGSLLACVVQRDSASERPMGLELVLVNSHGRKVRRLAWQPWLELGSASAWWRPSDFSPDGSTLLVDWDPSAYDSPTQVWAYPTAGGRGHLLLDDASDAQWQPVATRADLVVALQKLRTDVRATQRRYVDRLATALTLVSIDRHIAKSTNWLAFFWKAIRSSSETVLGVVDNLLGMGARDFVAGKLKDDPTQVLQAFDRYSSWAAENAGTMGGIKAFLFTSGLLGNFKDLADYELFCDGYSDLSKSADGYRKKYSSGNFTAIQRALTTEVGESDHLTIPLASGPLGSSGVPRATSYASCPNRALTALMKICDRTIASLPEKLPADLDVEALITEIKRVDALVKQQGIHGVPYECGYSTAGGWTTEQRKTQLGLLDDEYELLGRLADCFSANVNVQTIEAIQGSAEWTVSWLSSYGTIDGSRAWRIVGNLDLAAGAYSTGQQLMAPEAELAPIAAMNQLEVKMMLDTKEQLGRLYQVTAGLCGYVRSQMAD